MTKRKDLPSEYYKVINQGSQFYGMIGKVMNQGYSDGYGWYKYLAFPADMNPEKDALFFGNHELMYASVEEYDAQEDGRATEKMEQEGEQEGEQGGNPVEPA
jgi:hypothetical protein